MSKDQVNQQAFKDAEAQFLKEKTEEVKGYILETLKSIEREKKAKDLIEEKLRILKMDLEDLRNGKFDKIEERKAKSALAKSISVSSSGFVGFAQFTNAGCTSLSLSNVTNTVNWGNVTAGTYNTPTKTYYLA